MRGVLMALAFVMCVQPLRAQSPPAAPLNAQRPYDIDTRTLDIRPDAGVPPTEPRKKTAPVLQAQEPVFLRADNLTQDDKNNRVVAQGNVEVFYNRYILTADKVVYDRNLDKLTAEGNAQVTDPQGRITRADRFEATDDFRDAFVAALAGTGRRSTLLQRDKTTR